MDFYGLPLDMKKIIGSFFNDRSRRIMRSTSTEWFNIINYDQFTIYFASSSTLPDIVSVFQRYTKLIGLRFEKTAFPIDNNLTILASLTNLTSLEVEPTRHIEANCSDESLDPDPFTDLTALQKLHINGTHFTPYLINYFPNLTWISISNVFNFLLGLTLNSDHENGFITPQPVNIIAKLNNHSRIRTLEIKENKDILLFDEESVSKMSNLSKVSIECHRNCLFPFSKLPNLDSLDIESHLFDDFLTCTRLTRLQVGSTARDAELFHDKLQQISALTNLRHLKLLVNTEQDRCGYLSTLTNLEYLEVRAMGWPQLTGQFLEFINSSKLTSINLYAVDNLERVTKFTTLQAINIQSIYSTSIVPLHFPNATKLTTSEVSFARHCPNLRSLELIGSQRFEESKVIWSLTDLEMLSLSEGAFDNGSELDFCMLQQLTRLSKLSIWQGLDISIKHRGLWQSIATLTGLESLTLFHIPDDEGVKTLESLSHLKQLNIHGAEVFKLDEKKLSNLSNLQTLHLSNHPYGKVRPHNCQLTHLPYLYECS